MTQIQQQIESSRSSSSAELKFVHPSLLETWTADRVREHLGQACDTANGEITVEDALAMAKTGSAQIWAVMVGEEWIATIMTELAQYVSGKRVCRILLAGADSILPIRSGVVPHVPAAMQAIEEFALANDCTCVRMEGAPALSRLCPDYREIYRTYEKDLCHG